MNNLRLAREMCNKSQKEVAISLDVSAPTVSEWEKGKKTPTVENLKKLANEYQRSVDFLLGEQDKYFLDSSYMHALKKYCDTVGTNFSNIINFYQEHPLYVQRIQAGKKMSFPERVALKAILGGVEPAAAVCLGCSVLDNADDYSEYYIEHLDATPEEWDFLTRMAALPEKSRRAVHEVLDAALKGFEASTNIYSLSSTGKTHSTGSEEPRKRPMIPAAARSGNVTEIEAIYPDELPDDEPIP